MRNLWPILVCVALSLASVGVFLGAAAYLRPAEPAAPIISPAREPPRWSFRLERLRYDIKGLTVENDEPMLLDTLSGSTWVYRSGVIDGNLKEGWFYQHWYGEHPDRVGLRR